MKARKKTYVRPELELIGAIESFTTGGSHVGRVTSETNAKSEEEDGDDIGGTRSRQDRRRDLGA